MVAHYQPLNYHSLTNVPKVCAILGICLVFVVVWPEVDTNVSTYVQSTLSGASKEQALQLCWAAPANLRGSWLLAFGRTSSPKDCYTGNIPSHYLSTKALFIVYQQA